MDMVIKRMFDMQTLLLKVMNNTEGKTSLNTILEISMDNHKWFKEEIYTLGSLKL